MDPLVDGLGLPSHRLVRLSVVGVRVGEIVLYLVLVAEAERIRVKWMMIWVLEKEKTLVHDVGDCRSHWESYNFGFEAGSALGCWMCSRCWQMKPGSSQGRLCYLSQ